MFRYGELDKVMAFYNDVVMRRTLSAWQRGTPNWALGGRGSPQRRGKKGVGHRGAWRMAHGKTGGIDLPRKPA